MVIVPCKKETRSNLILFRDRRVRKQPTSQRAVAEVVSNYLAGRDAPPAGLFILETSGGAEDLLRAAKRCCEAGEVPIVAYGCGEPASRRAGAIHGDENCARRAAREVPGGRLAGIANKDLSCGIASGNEIRRA